MILKEEVYKVQEKWAEGLIKMGTTVNDRILLEKVSLKILKQLYAFDEKNAILFKPTKASIIQFRTNLEGVISYFIGGNQKYPKDKGFALKPWIKIRFDNKGLILESKRAIAMGNYFFTDSSNSETKVEYTFGYIKNDKNELKIDLHHSSFPFNI